MDKKTESENKKYYFITYIEEHLEFNEKFIENDVIDYHPIEFVFKYEESRILFYREIPKELYEKYKVKFDNK